LSHFERGHIVSERLAGASVTKSATLLGVLRATVFKGYVGIQDSWEDNISEEKQWESGLRERDRRALRIVSENHRTTAAQVTRQQN
jgi:hypothetical protein